MPDLLLAIDDSEATRHMVDYVAEIAPQLRDCKIRLISIIPDIPSDSQQLAALLGKAEEPELHGDKDQHESLHAAYNHLSDIKDRFLEAGMAPHTVTSEILPERLGVAQDLHDEAAEQDCDTIVVGRRSSTLSHIFGSVSSNLVRKAHPLSVWVVG